MNEPIDSSAANDQWLRISRIVAAITIVGLAAFVWFNWDFRRGTLDRVLFPAALILVNLIDLLRLRGISRLVLKILAGVIALVGLTLFISKLVTR
jgi:hypothetical protein